MDKKAEINLKLVVADSTFDSFQRIARAKLAQSWLTWWIQPLSYVLLSDYWAPEDLKLLSPVPVLVIHGLKDMVVEPELGEKIFEKLAEPKTLWRISGGAHTDVFWQHDYKYRVCYYTSKNDLRTVSGLSFRTIWNVLNLLQVVKYIYLSSIYIVEDRLKSKKCG